MPGGGDYDIIREAEVVVSHFLFANRLEMP